MEESSGGMGGGGLPGGLCGRPAAGRPAGRRLRRVLNQWFFKINHWCMAPSRPPKRCCRRLKRRTRRLKRLCPWAETKRPSTKATKSFHSRVICISL